MATGLYVVKRNGSKEEVHFDKITERIKKLTYGLDRRYIDPVSARDWTWVHAPAPRSLFPPAWRCAQGSPSAAVRPHRRTVDRLVPPAWCGAVA